MAADNLLDGEILGIATTADLATLPMPEVFPEHISTELERVFPWITEADEWDVELLEAEISWIRGCMLGQQDACLETLGFELTDSP